MYAGRSLLRRGRGTRWSLGETGLGSGEACGGGYSQRAGARVRTKPDGGQRMQVGVRKARVDVVVCGRDGVSMFASSGAPTTVILQFRGPPVTCSASLTTHLTTHRI
jgi:hypothetical protein